MKILMVNKFLYPNGGSETYIFELGKQLQKMGHEVQYFGMEHPDRCVGNNAGAYTSNMDFHSSGKAGGLTAKLAKLTYPFKIIYSFEARKKIRLVLEDMKPDVVHLNNINFQITPSIIYEIKTWNKDCKIVFTAHDYQWVCPNHMMYTADASGVSHVCEECIGGRYLNCTKHNCIHSSKVKSMLGSIEGYYYKWRKTYGMVDAVIAPSKFLYDKLATDAVLRDKLTMMHNFLTVTDKPGKVTADEEYVLYFGRFSQEKGVRTLIEVCKRLPEIDFVFAGSGPLVSDMSGITNIRNVGFKSGDELRELISGARFSVYPSEWYENCPFSVMESQMYGTPVLGADIGGIPELIDVGRTGELFAAGDADALEKAIYDMWTNSAKLDEYTANCAKLEFDNVEEYTEKLMKVYEAE